jgi:hypothetical protein
VGASQPPLPGYALGARAGADDSDTLAVEPVLFGPPGSVHDAALEGLQTGGVGQPWLLQGAHPEHERVSGPLPAVGGHQPPPQGRRVVLRGPQVRAESHLAAHAMAVGDVLQVVPDLSGSCEVAGPVRLLGRRRRRRAGPGCRRRTPGTGWEPSQRQVTSSKLPSVEVESVS